MRKVIASEFMTLDGVIQAAGPDEGHPDGKDGWSLEHFDDEMAKLKFEEVATAGALLLGRVTYELFAAFWPNAGDLGDGGEFARLMNGLPKFVASRTLKKAEWENTTIISGDVADSVSELKEQPGGDILINGSADLVNALMQDDLIDEFRLMVHPLVLGSGKRLFWDGTDTRPLRLAETRAFDKGVVLLTYHLEEASNGAGSS